MSQLKIDPATGDLAIENNRFVLVSGDEEIAQRIAQYLRTGLGEWFLDVTIGLPWIQIIFQKGTPPSLVDGLIKNMILSVPGVSVLKEYEPLDLQPNRTLRVNFKVVTENNTVLTIQEAIP